MTEKKNEFSALINATMATKMCECDSAAQEKTFGPFVIRIVDQAIAAFHPYVNIMLRAST
jgi:hypothetical protein